MATYLLLPHYGYGDPDDQAGFVFTDAHRRDAQAWDLAASDLPIVDAFSQNYAYDQYGGLLAFSALVYRYFSPDVHRPLMLILISAFVAALGIPFLWKAACKHWNERIAGAACWIFALYPESLLLGGAAMREPYLMTFSAFALWGFVDWFARDERRRGGLLWIGLGILGMLLVSPAAALVTLVILAGWLYLSSERGRIPWWAAAVALMVFVAGLFLLSSALDRQGNLGAVTPFGVVNSWLKQAVKWDVYQTVQGSGWVQKLFDEMPEWMRLPFVTIYGVFQPVLPAAIVEPTTVFWKVVALLRAAGWYVLLPALVQALASSLRGPALPAARTVVAGTGPGRHPEREESQDTDRRVWLWLAAVCWAWILLTSLRGGGDQWDNPRYRAILFLWQALLAGWALVRWRETRSTALFQIVACEAVFLVVFTQWYASRYFHWGGQLPFGGMVTLILALWAAVFLTGWLWTRRALPKPGA